MSPFITRARTSTGAGVIALLAMVLAFGNQAYVEWADKHAQDANAWHLILRTLSWPRWYLTSGGNATRDVIAFNIRALLLVVLVAALLGVIGANVLAAGGGAFVLGWFSVLVGAALATLLTTFLTTNATLYNALLSAQAASAYGLFVGWIVGMVAAVTRRPVVPAAV